MADLEKSDNNKKAREVPKVLPDMSRRQFMLAGGAGALGLYAASHGASLLRSRDPLADARMLRADIARKALGMAPGTDQYFVAYQSSVGATYAALDFYETVYSRAPLADNFETSLVRINPNYGIVPGTATQLVADLVRRPGSSTSCPGSCGATATS